MVTGPEGLRRVAVQYRTVAFAALSCLLVANAVRADVQLTVVPATIELQGREPASVLVIVKSTAESLEGVRLSNLADPTLAVAPGGAEVASLPAGGSHAWAVQVTSRADEFEKRKLVFQVHFEAEAAGAAESQPGVRAIAVDVTGREPPLLSNLATLEVVPLQGSIGEMRPAHVALVVRNTSHRVLTLTHVCCRRPFELEVQRVGGEPRSPALEDHDALPLTCVTPVRLDPISIGPGDSEAVELKVGLGASGIQPGKQKLVFEAVLQWEYFGRKQIGSLVRDHEVELGIVGESQLLTLLGVPSFLVLPGFLVIVTMSLLWRLGWKPPEKDANASFPLPAAQPEFWVVAVAISIAAVPLYWLTGRNYLAGYALRDLVLVYGGSIALGAIVYTVILLILRAVHRSRQKRLFSARDDPLTVLRKLHKAGLTLSLPRVEWQDGGKTFQGFLVVPEKIHRDGMDVWIAPQILLDVASLDAEVGKNLEECLNNPDEVEELADFLQSQGVGASFEAKGLTRLRRVKAQDVTVKNPDVFVRRE